MKVLKRILIGVVALLVLVVVVVAIMLQSRKPVYDGKIQITGLKESVEVLYDSYGVPHIYAKNLEDAYLTLGYVHAQDRLFQMEMLRRAAGGRLAEVLGPDLIPIDKLFRTLGLNRFATDQANKNLSADTAAWQRAAHAYQKGINEFIKSGPTPVEFTIIGIPKQEFTARDIYLAVGFMSFGFAEGLRVDPVLEKIKSERGEEYLKVFNISTPPDAIRIPVESGPARQATTRRLVAAVSNALESLPIPMLIGSNGWVVSGDRTSSGFPILANDTHIGFSQPPPFYEAHLEFPDHSFYGHYLAGIPFGLLGNNRFCGWGLTMFENDDTDFFTETVNPNNANQVRFKDQWEELTSRQEIIHVKGQTDVLLEVRASHHGYLINGILDNTEPSTPVALSWTLTSSGNNDALEAAWRLNHATSLSDATRAASLFSAPGLNVMYGDTEGNIAWWACARLPIRPAHVQSKFFLDGASGLNEYNGYYEFSKNPHSINPVSGFVYSANNQPDSVDGVLYPGYYYPRSRPERITSLLSADKRWTIHDMQVVNTDVVSQTAKAISKEMAARLRSLNDAEFEPLIRPLEQWDGDHQIDAIAPSIYYNLLSQLLYSSMHDELGSKAFNSLMHTSVVKGSYLRILQSESPWWDDTLTSDIHETRQDIYRRAAKQTLSLLHSTCGNDPEGWTWGKVHTLTHRHPLAAVKPLDRIFNVGPFSVPGGLEVINNLSFEIDTTGMFNVTSGPALRKVTDFGDVQHGKTVGPTGQSGNIMSDFYDDQAAMYATGGSRTMLMNRAEIEKNLKGKLVLAP